MMTFEHADKFIMAAAREKQPNSFILDGDMLLRKETKSARWCEQTLYQLIPERHETIWTIWTIQTRRAKLAQLVYGLGTARRRALPECDNVDPSLRQRSIDRKHPTHVPKYETGHQCLAFADCYLSLMLLHCCNFNHCFKWRLFKIIGYSRRALKPLSLIMETNQPNHGEGEIQY